MTHGRVVAPALTGFLVLGLVVGALGQSPRSSGTSEASPAPKAVPLGQINAESQALTSQLAQIEAQRPTDALAEAEVKLDELGANAAPAVARAQEVLERRAAPGELDDQATTLRILVRQFEALAHRVGGQADALDKKHSEIARQMERWKLTLDEARSKRAPPAVKLLAEQSLRDLARARKQVGDDLAAVVALQDRVRAADRQLQGALQQIEAKQNQIAAEVFVRQDEPLWRSVPTRAEVAAIPGALAHEFSSIWSELVSYTGAGVHRDALIVQGLIFLFLGWLLSRTRARRDRHHPERAGEGPDALRRPWAAAFLIAALLTPFLRERNRGFQLAVTPVALVAWIRVLRGMLPSAFLRPLIGLGVMALLEIVRIIIPGVPIVDRALLGLDLALALAGVLWLRRPSRLAHVPGRGTPGPWLWFLGAWMRLAVPALAGGVLAVLLGYTTLATRISFFTIWGTALGAAWLALVRIGEAGAEHAVEDTEFGRLRIVRAARPTVLRLLNFGLRTFGLLGWMYAILTLVGLWTPARSFAAAALSASVGYGPVSISVGGVIAFFLTLWLSWLLARFVSFALDQEVFARVRMPPGVPFAVATFARYTILVIGFVLAMGALGFSLDRVTLLLGAVGVGIGFGLQNVVNNFVSGVILLFERPIRMGDWVQLGDLFGTVSAIGIRASQVRTFDGADVIVPNGDFVSAQVINWTLSDRKRRIILPVGVAYGTKPRQVIELLEQVARSHPQVLGDPAPVALFRGFGDSSLDFELRAFTEGDWLGVTSDLAVAISEAFEAAGITIPFPQRDLHLRNIPELRDALQEVAHSPRSELRGGPAPPGDRERG